MTYDQPVCKRPHGAWLTAALALAALVLLAVAAVSAAASGVVPSRSISPGHGHPYVPAAGDWEGTVDGLPASFQLAHMPAFSARYGTPPYGFSDLVLAQPTSCSADASGVTFTTTDEGTFSPVRSDGSFGLRGSISGGLTASRSVRLTKRVVLPAAHSHSGCVLQRTWHLHPAHRRAVQGGGWTLHYSDGTGSRFEVTAGGRIATGVQTPSSLSNCGLTGLGAVNLFVSAAGAGAYDARNVYRLAILFAREEAQGRLTVLGGSCAGQTIMLTASRG